METFVLQKKKEGRSLQKFKKKLLANGIICNMNKTISCTIKRRIIVTKCIRKLCNAKKCCLYYYYFFARQLSPSSVNLLIMIILEERIEIRCANEKFTKINVMLNEPPPPKVPYSFIRKQVRKRQNVRVSK